ncbi:MAG TPA: lysylphosphatidylglycerol synthase domain-containing protein [Lysobacter sp.]
MSIRRDSWRRARRIGFFLFLAVVAWLLARYAMAVDWAQVAHALRSYSGGAIVAALSLTLASYLVYCGYELAARTYSRHGLPTPRVMAIAGIVYAFSLNVGAVVGGAGLRYRLYSHEGLALGTISRIAAFAVATNWLGYLLLTGALFAAGQVAMPVSWGWSGTGLRWLGVAMLSGVTVYLVACASAHDRVFHVRGHHFRLPTLSLALLQLLLATGNWALMGWLLNLLMPPALGYTAVLGALLVAAVASAIAHIPAGIGVIEAVFLALFGHTVPAPQLLAALLAYRACYYLVPLMLAVPGYAVLESGSRRKPQA